MQDQDRLQERIEAVEAEIVAELKRIYKIPIQNLNEQEIGFLRARRSYMEDDKQVKYASVLEDKPKK
jgi:hypothetical protein